MNGKQLKNSILQWAIQGKLVPQDPNDEPASVLLERIRAEKARMVKEGKIKKDKNESIIFRGEDNSHYEKFPDGRVKCINEEIPFEIPQNWEWARVSTVVQLNPKNHADDSTLAGFVPMERIDATYLSSFSFAVKKWKEIKNGFTHFADGDVAMAKITPCFQNRKSMILKGLPNGIGAGTTELKVLRTYSDTVSKEYLLLFLESPFFVEEASFKGTANQQRIISGYLENKLFPLPPRKEQDRIVAVIKDSFVVADRYDIAQNKLDHLNSTLNSLLKKSILQEAIQGKLVPQDPNDETADLLLDRIRTEKIILLNEGIIRKKDIVDSVIFKGKDNKYYEKVDGKTLDISNEIPFDIPDSWAWSRLESITYSVGQKENLVKTKDIQKEGPFPVVSQGQSLIDGYTNEKWKVISDLPLVMFGDHTRNVKIIEFPFVIGAEGTKFHKCIVINPRYLYYWMKATASDIRDRGYARHYSLLKKVPVPLPPIQEQKRIVGTLNELCRLL